jgi:hypothetical protein
MRKVSDALKTLVEENALLQMGIPLRLYNLSQLARHLQPQVEALTNKEVQPAAIVMNLSRLQRKLASKVLPPEFEISIDNIIVRSDLFTVTYLKAKDVHRSVNVLHSKIEKAGGYLTISEGMNEITLILERRYAELIRALISQKPIYRHDHLASIAVNLTKRYLETPGFFYLMFQQLYLQNINIFEIASTATELIFYVDQDAVRLAFDTLYNRFAKKKRKKQKDFT